jgi:hypothetical protein
MLPLVVIHELFVEAHSWFVEIFGGDPRNFGSGEHKRHVQQYLYFFGQQADLLIFFKGVSRFFL